MIQDRQNDDFAYSDRLTTHISYESLKFASTNANQGAGFLVSQLSLSFQVQLAALMFRPPPFPIFSI
jgi:hypothetical protein